MIGRFIKTMVLAWISQKAIGWIMGDKRQSAPVRGTNRRVR